MHKIKLIISAALLMLLLTACHGSTESPEFVVPDNFDTSRVHEITFWAKNDTNKTQTDIYRRAIEDFESLYPNITVNLRLYTDYGKIYNDVITNIATGTTPNVCITYPDHIATYLMGANTVVPLDSLFADEAYGFGGRELRFTSPTPTDIIPQFLNEGEFGGYHYAMPFMRSTEACYVNKTYVEALGFELPEVLTWDFVWQVSEAAMEKDGDTFRVNGQSILIPFIYKSTDNMMIQQLRQLGGGYSTPAGSIELFNDTTAQLLYTIAEHTKTGAFSTFKVSSYPANFFNAGQCIFAIDSTAGATWMGTDAPLSDISEDKLVQFETAVMAIPQFDTTKPQMLSQGPSVCVFNKSDAQEVLASWLFASYLLTDEVQIAYAKTEGYVPVTSTAQGSDAYLNYLSRCGEDSIEFYKVKICAAELLLNNVGNTFTTPVFNGSASLRDAAGQLIENVVKSVRRRETINEDYMTALFNDVTALYRLNESSASGERVEFGPLPRTARLLVAGLATTWGLIGAYVIASAMKKKTAKRR